MEGLASTLYINDYYVHSGICTLRKSISTAAQIHGRMRERHEQTFEQEHWKFRQLARISGKTHDQTKHLQ